MMLGHLGQLLGLRSMIPYGMVKTAEQLSPVSVPSTTLPGSASSFPSPQLHDDTEVRICGSHTISNEDTPVEFMELYIH